MTDILDLMESDMGKSYHELKDKFLNASLDRLGTRLKLAHECIVDRDACIVKLEARIKKIDVGDRNKQDGKQVPWVEAKGEDSWWVRHWAKLDSLTGKPGPALATAISSAFEFDTPVDWADKLKAAKVAITMTRADYMRSDELLGKVENLRKEIKQAHQDTKVLQNRIRHLEYFSDR